MKHIFIDFEMNPISKLHKEERKICKNEIIEIGAVILDENFVEFKQYSQYVKPMYNERVNTRITELTGIKTEDILNAPIFEDAVMDFINFCIKYCGKDNYKVYAWSQTDLEQLEKECKLKNFEQDENYNYLKENWIDFQKEYSKILNITSVMSLEKAISSIETEFDGKAHDAMWDAKNTAKLFVLSQDEEKFKEIMKPILDNFKQEKEPVASCLGELFNFDLYDFCE